VGNITGVGAGRTSFEPHRADDANSVAHQAQPEAPVSDAPAVTSAPGDAELQCTLVQARVDGALSTDAPDPPADLQQSVGTVDYYRRRAEDFRSRHPGVEPPDYYMSYGDKYAHRFLDETFPKLSPDGQAWLMRTFENLQQRMEDLRQADPAAFDRLEQDPDAFRAFAYATHSDAYVEAGLADLSPSDLLAVARTPDFADLATLDGVSQMAETGVRVARTWGERGIDRATEWGSEVVQDVERTASDAVDTVRGAVDTVRDVGRRLGDIL